MAVAAPLVFLAFAMLGVLVVLVTAARMMSMERSVARPAVVAPTPLQVATPAPAPLAA